MSTFPCGCDPTNASGPHWCAECTPSVKMQKVIVAMSIEAPSHEMAKVVAAHLLSLLDAGTVQSIAGEEKHGGE